MLPIANKIAMVEKISISLDDEIVQVIDAVRGDVPRSKYIENIIRSSGMFFRALWIFSDELDQVSSRERWLVAHTSQPMGKPLHKHEGYVLASGDDLKFYDNQKNLVFTMNRGTIKGMEVGYDGTFKRLRDSRGAIPPMIIKTERRTVYLFTSPIAKKRLRGDKIFRGENRALETWFQDSLGMINERV